MVATWLIPADATSGGMIALFGFLGGLLGLVLLGLGVLVWNLYRAPYRQRNEARGTVIKLEESVKPSLEIIEATGQKGGAFGKGFGWGLRIQNIGIDEAVDCTARLEQIMFESRSSGTLKGASVDRLLHWSGQLEGVHDINISGGQIARLNIIYYDYRQSHKPDSITIAYRADPKVRLSHELSAFNEPILLLLNITCSGKSPQYVVCRIDLEALARNLAVEPEPPFNILWKGVTRRDLADFTKSNQEVSS